MMPWLAHLQPLSRSRAWTCWAATSALAPTRQSLGEQAMPGSARHQMHEVQRCVMLQRAKYPPALVPCHGLCHRSLSST